MTAGCGVGSRLVGRQALACKTGRSGEAISGILWPGIPNLAKDLLAFVA